MWNLWSSYLTLGQKKTSKVFCERDMQAFEGMSLITTVISLCFAVSVKSGRWNLKKKKKKKLVMNRHPQQFFRASSTPWCFPTVFVLQISFHISFLCVGTAVNAFPVEGTVLGVRMCAGSTVTAESYCWHGFKTGRSSFCCTADKNFFFFLKIWTNGRIFLSCFSGPINCCSALMLNRDEAWQKSNS